MFDKKKPRKVNALITGLDAAGKTTILYKLKLGEVVTTIPTIGFNVESVDYKEIQLTGWDLGGRGGSRHLYRHYLTNTQAVIYVVDANDQDRAKRDKIEAQMKSLRTCARRTAHSFECDNERLRLFGLRLSLAAKASIWACLIASARWTLW